MHPSKILYAKLGNWGFHFYEPNLKKYLLFFHHQSLNKKIIKHENHSTPWLNLDLKKNLIQYIYRNKSIQKNHNLFVIVST